MSDAQMADLMQEMAAAGLLPPPAEITVEDETESETPEQDFAVTAPIPEAELEALEGELELADAKREVYAEQPAEGEGFVEPVMVETLPEREPEAVEVPAPVEAPKVERKPAAPRVSRFAIGAGSYVAGLAGDPELAAIVDGLPKKVKDKAANLIEHVQKGKALSVYTQTAIGLVRDTGALTSKALVDAYLAQSKRSGGEGYSIGTARSQAQQMMTLLTRLGILVKSGDALAINHASPLAARLFPVVELAEAA